MQNKQIVSSRNRFQAFKGRSKAGRVIPLAAPGRHRFQVIGFPVLLSCFTELMKELEQAGVQAVLRSEGDVQQVGIHLPGFEASVSVRPSPDHPFLQATVEDGCIHPRRLDWFIPYHFLESAAIDRELRAAVKDLIHTHADPQAAPDKHFVRLR